MRPLPIFGAALVLASDISSAEGASAGLPPSVVSCQVDETVMVGDTATLRVLVEGTPPFRYRWGLRRGALAIPDATNATLVLSDVAFDEASDDYWVSVENDFGSTHCENIRLTVLPRSLVPGFIDTGFKGVPGYARSAVVLANGQMVAGGNAGIVRMHSDGAPDPSFVSDSSANVASIVVQPDGKVVAMSGNGGLRECSRQILRLNADGMLDATFSPDLSGGNEFVLTTCVSAFGVQSNNKVLVVSRLYWAGSEDNYWLDPILRRLNPDGTFDATFTIGHVSCGGLQALSILPDDRVLVGSLGVVRLHANGLVDPTFQTLPLGPRPGACRVPGLVYCIALQPDGRILIGGSFTTVAAKTVPYVARLQRGGDLDPTFNPPQLAGHEEVIVRALAVQPDGRILVGGNFEEASGSPREGLVRLHPDGSLDHEFITGRGLLAEDEDTVTTITVLGDGSKALIGGSVGQYWGRSADRLVRIHLIPGPSDADSDELPDTWESRHFGSIQDGVAEGDFDSDGMSNRDEFHAGTDPTRASSVLRMEIAAREEGWAIVFNSVFGKRYQLETASDLMSADWRSLAAAITGTGESVERWIGRPGLSQFYRLRTAPSDELAR